MRTLAAQAREMLLARTQTLLADESARVRARLEPVTPPPDAAAGLHDAMRTIEQAR